MSISFPFNNGIGPGAGGCAGQSPLNCNTDYSGCCSTPAGPTLSAYLSTRNVSFTPMNITDSVQWVQAQSKPYVQDKKLPKLLPHKKTPLNTIGVI